MNIPKGLIKQGAKATGEAYKDNYQTPRYILDLVDEFFGAAGWEDPFPVNPQFDAFAENIVFKKHNSYYINPPFSQYAKAVSLFEDVSEVIWILDNVKTETTYGQKLLSNATAVCYLSKRVNFLDPRTGEPYKIWNEKKQKFEPGSNRSGQLLIYTGLRDMAFVETFRKLGVTKVTSDGE